MKIVRDIPEQLIIDSRPVVLTIALTLMAVVFIGAGLAQLLSGEIAGGLVWLGFCIPFFGLFFVLFIRRNQLIIDGVAGTVTMRRKTLLKYTEVVHELEHLQKAIVETSRNSDGKSTRRMALVLDGGMDAGTHPFTLVYSSGGGARRGADAVNRWLAQHRST